MLIWLDGLSNEAFARTVNDPIKIEHVLFTFTILLVDDYFVFSVH